MARLSSSVLLLLGTVCTPLALDASAAAPTPLPVATASVGTSALATASVGTAGGAGTPAPAASVGPNAAAIAASAPRLLIQGHQFTPAELHVPSGRKLVLEVENRDNSVEEFESYDLDREQRVQPGEVARVNLGPLAPGRYPFFGDFHRKSAQGVLVVD